MLSQPDYSCDEVFLVCNLEYLILFLFNRALGSARPTRAFTERSRGVVYGVHTGSRAKPRADWVSFPVVNTNGRTGDL